MAFIDEITIHAKAGDGGNGVVRWLHKKNEEFGGPAGGDGGRGGSVYALAVRNTHLLVKYKGVKEFRAKDGGDGMSKSLHGVNGQELDIELPIGSVIENLATKEKYSLTEEGQRVLLLRGGTGGRGNESFKSSTNTKPEECTEGRKGKEADFYIEVELIADIGLIGLPNAGKTSLLNEVTNADAKVGDYAFTTLEPNLGAVHGYIISDIPGLIEGASSGKGLGHKFLRHVRRTKMLVHLISLENEDVLSAYKTVRKELEQFDAELAQKKEVVVLTKTDLVEDPKVVEKTVAKLKKENPDVLAVTMYDDEQVKTLLDTLIKIVKTETK